MSLIRIHQGVFKHGSRETAVKDIVVELAKEYSIDDRSGPHVTVMGNPQFGLPNRKCRICVTGPEDFEVLDGEADAVSVDTRTAQERFFAQETDEAAMERIARSFDILNEITDAAAQGIIRGVVVSGPPGIGKSYGVGKTLEQANFLPAIAGQSESYEMISGSMTPIGLYKKLYLNRHKGFVTVLDDCDTVLFDEQSLNLLKAALDTTERRRLHWLSESHALAKEEIPDCFDFEGSIVFLTNLDFEDVKSSKLQAHLSAILSRCHYMNLEISTVRDQLLRIRQVVNFGMLDSYALTGAQKQEVVDFVIDNVDDMKELSLRAVIKLADLAEADHKGSLQRSWKELAELTMLTKQSYYKRQLAKIQVDKPAYLQYNIDTVRTERNIP